MSGYVYFTDEQKQRANEVDLEYFFHQRGEILLASGREKRLKSDHSITVRGNEWYDHAKGKGGLAIDFVQNFYGLPFPDAVTMLLGGESGEAYHCAEKKEEIKKPFVLPPQNKDMRRTFAYLIKHRCIDSDVVSFFAREKLLYESCEKSADGTWTVNKSSAASYSADIGRGLLTTAYTISGFLKALLTGSWRVFCYRKADTPVQEVITWMLTFPII